MPSGSVIWDSDEALLQREASLEPRPESAGEARRIVRTFLDDAGRSEWLDAAELAVTEVVTNAALHAHTEIHLRLLAYEDRACVEVRDHDPVLPRQRDYDSQATTGRGMSLVSALTLECGVHSLGADGKIVWFCVGDEVERSTDDLLAMWDIDGWEEEVSKAGEEVATVRLLSLPPTLWLSTRQHHDAILRELVLYRAEHGDGGEDVVAVDRARFRVSNAVVAAVEAAHARGETRPALPEGHPSPLPWVPAQLDLTLEVPAGAGPEYGALQDALDAAERLATDGELLVRPALPEVVAVRDWACEQIIAQLAGVAPAPWPGVDQERFETEVNDDGAELDWDASVVTTSDRAVIAADDANRIIAVSRPLTELLGWQGDDLVGRRVVTVIPPALREAHVAGFSRHLTTGEAHVLGVPLELPVLCRDGGEVQCRFLVEQAEATAGRAVYLAWLDPIGR